MKQVYVFDNLIQSDGSRVEVEINLCQFIQLHDISIRAQNAADIFIERFVI